jgi:hypothetical protein
VEYTYTRIGAAGFRETVEVVEREIRSHGFGISRSHDLQTTLAAKGFSIEPIWIFEVAIPGLDSAVPGACKFHVYLQEGKVHVSAITPWVLWGAGVMDKMASNPEFAAAESAVVSVVDAATE